jgi:tetratricopeptide (TPR) repeat protein
VHRYVLLLASLNRLDDALVVVETALKFDPRNAALQSLYAQLENIRLAGGGLEFQSAFNEAAVHINQGRREEAFRLFDQILASPQADATTVISIAQAYIELNEPLRLEQALLRLVQVTPANPEAWYDLAATQAALGRNQDALKHLRRAIELSQDRLRTDPGQRNLIIEARRDPRFAEIQHTAEFQRLMRGR